MRKLTPVLFLFLSVSGQAEIQDPPRASVDAKEVYAGIPETLLRADHEDLKTALKSHVMTPGEWVNQLNSERLDVLCVGETHSNEYRKLLTDTIFSNLKIDHLMLETQSADAADLLVQTKRSKTTQLLGADISSLLKQALTVNPHLQISGIEQTKIQSAQALKEKLNLNRSKISRDSFIALNLLSSLKPGQRHVVLYGSTHCGRFSDGLGLDTPFYRLLERELASRQLVQNNVKVISSSKYPALESLLKQYGYLKKEPLILSDLGTLPSAAYNYLLEFNSLFINYNNLILVP